MQKFNVCVKKTYTTKDGQEKTAWPRVGSIIIFPASGGKDEGGYLELDMFPETKYHVFTFKEKKANDDDL